MPRPFRFAVQSFSADSAAQWRERARRAEALGYSALHLADHVIGDGPALQSTNHPLQTLAAVPAIMAAACATETLRVGCRVFCMDYRPAAVLAKEAATLDLLSDGRLELGVGAGWLKAEYEAIGLHFAPAPQRITRLAETVQLLKQHCADAPVLVEGAQVQARGFSGAPKPVQRPHPPLMIGGGGRRVLELAAREADIVSFNFNNRSGVIGPEGVQSGTAKATAEKVQWVRAAAGALKRDPEFEIGAYFTFVGAGATEALDGMSAALGLSKADLKAHPHALFGEANEVAEELQRRRELYGISYVTVGDEAMEAFAPVVAKLKGR